MVLKLHITAPLPTRRPLLSKENVGQEEVNECFEIFQKLDHCVMLEPFKNDFIPPTGEVGGNSGLHEPGRGGREERVVGDHQSQ